MKICGAKIPDLIITFPLFFFLHMIMGACTDVFNHRVQPLSTDK